MVSQKEGLTFVSRLERLAFIKQRYQRLILDAREGGDEMDPVADIDDEDDMEEPLVEVVVDDFDYDEN